MNWIVDYKHSQIQATVRHMMISKVHGSFDRFTVNAEIDEEHVAQSTVKVEIEAASVNTRDEKRDGHLRSADFLDVEKFPSITFKSKRSEVIDASHGRMTGDLTIRGVAHEVVLDVEHLGNGKSPWGTINAGFTAHAKVSRKDWGLNWNAALETGGWLVSDEVNIDIEIEFTQVPELVEQAKPGEPVKVAA